MYFFLRKFGGSIKSIEEIKEILFSSNLQKINSISIQGILLKLIKHNLNYCLQITIS